MGFTQTLLSTLGINIGNSQDYPIGSMNYFVILGTSVLSFSKISGITLYTNKTMAVNEGGMLEPYIVEEPNSELNTLHLEKGYGTMDVLDVIPNAKAMILIIKGQDNEIKGVYQTSRMMVKDVTLSDLDASKSAVLIQNMSISYTSLKSVSAAVKLGLKGLFSVMDFNNSSSQAEEIKNYTQKLSEGKKKTPEKDASVTDTRTQYEREQEQIKKDTERLKKLKQEGTSKNAAVEQASKVNQKIQEENQKKEEAARKIEQEKQQQLEKLIEL
ncbi:MAG: hypothetical protein GX299_10200 [Epulopiscium sp.]|jgi:hypothetical protein|nr:hypothetical protein [Candidatus Epulonipiscium sp.]